MPKLKSVGHTDRIVMTDTDQHDDHVKLIIMTIMLTLHPSA
jgi:hypothetical protein